MAKQRIGVFGGSFDPIHMGHIHIALHVLDAFELDRLIVLPTGNPPYKTCTASAEDRWRMVTAACAFDSRLVPSRLELERPGKVYTIDTLLALKKEYPSARLLYVIGADSLMKVSGWHCSRDVLSICSFVVFPRDTVDPEDLKHEVKRLESMGGKVSVLAAEPVSFSSTELRASLSSGVLSPALNVAVLEYCACKGLYSVPVRVPQAGEWIDMLFSSLKPHRFAHSLSVAYEARRLALIHGIDPLKAEQAGLLHDCAKCLPLSEMQNIARDHSLTNDPSILSSEALLHSLAGAQVAHDRYGMTDPDVLDAISFHNTGFPGMSRLAMCICLADSIEPLRAGYSRLSQVRALAESSLEQALLLSLEGTADYVLSRGQYLHPRTRNTIDWLRDLVRRQKNVSVSL